MTDDKAPLYLSLVAAALLGTALLTLQPYTAEPFGGGFGKPAERYVRAALAQDSVALVGSPSATARDLGACGGAPLPQRRSPPGRTIPRRGPASDAATRRRSSCTAPRPSAATRRFSSGSSTRGAAPR